MFFHDASFKLPSIQSSANPHGLNNYNLFSFNKSPSYQVNEGQKTYIQGSMNAILEDFQKDKIWVIDHFSKKKKMKKPFFVKQHFKHQLTLQNKQSLSDSCYYNHRIRIFRGKTSSKMYCPQWSILNYSFTNEQIEVRGYYQLYFNYHIRLLYLTESSSQFS